MRKALTGFMVFVAFLLFCIVAANSQANPKQDSFCDGFKEGYLSVKGKNAYVPACPYAPFTPYNSTDFREGIKAGIKKAQSK